MLNYIKNILETSNLTNENKKILLAYSGGYDSSVLLDILINLRNEYHFTLYTAHINHGWRNEISDKEEEFCKNFCDKNNVKIFVKKLDKNLPHNEEIARIERYKFFKEIYEQNNCDALITAHTKSDNVETLIYRLIKGTGIKGLCGIPEYSEQNGMLIIRPLLNFSRKDIENYIKINNLTANFDLSNNDVKYKRNKIRNDILPEISAISASYENNINNLSKIANYYENSIDNLLNQINIFCENQINTKTFMLQEKNLKFIILHKFLILNNIEPNFQQIEKLISDLNDKIPQSGKYFSIQKDKFIYINNNYIKITSKHNIDISKFSLKISEADDFNNSYQDGTKNYIYVNSECVKEPLKIRIRQDGDIFQPFGMKGKMKLKKFLNSKKIPKFERDNLIIIENSTNEILWIYPLATSEITRISDKTPVKLQLIFNK